MLRNKPKAIAGQLDRCDVCGNKMHRSDLVRTQVEWLYPAHENYFPYSRYDGTYWVVDTATDASTISYGNRQDRTRLSLADDNTFSTIDGVQTWTGSGVFRSTTVGSSTSGNVTFSAQVGPYYRNTSPEMTVVLGTCNTDGTNKNVVKTFTTASSNRLWFTEDYATLAATHGSSTMCYYIAVTNTGNWWVDELQLEFGNADLKPGPYVETNGTLVSATAEAAQISARKVCNECFETVWRRSEKFGRTQEPQTDLPVDDYKQEF